MIRSALIVWAALAALPAGAAEDEVHFSIRPAAPNPEVPQTRAWLIHLADPGDRLADAVVVANLGSKPLALDLYPADRGPGERFALEPAEAPRRGVSAWVSLSRDRVLLGPGESARVAVRVRVPPDAPLGQHAGGIVARTVEPIRRGDLPTLLAVGARLYLTVGGKPALTPGAIHTASGPAWPVPVALLMIGAVASAQLASRRRRAA